jgi:transposase
VPDSTSLPAAVVADTIVRTVELGVTITDAAVDGAVTVVFCNLLDDGKKDCPGCGAQGVYRDTVIRRITDIPVVGHPLRLQVRIPATDAWRLTVTEKCSPTTPIVWLAAARRPRGAVPATSAVG